MSEQHRSGRFEWSVYARSWWKLVVAGSVLVVAVMVGSAAGIDAWFLGIFAVTLACLLLMVGLVLGVIRLVSLRRSTTRARAA